MLGRFRDGDLQEIEGDIVRHRQDNSTYSMQTLRLSKGYRIKTKTHIHIEKSTSSKIGKNIYLLWPNVYLEEIACGSSFL